MAGEGQKSGGKGIWLLVAVILVLAGAAAAAVLTGALDSLLKSQ